MLPTITGSIAAVLRISRFGRAGQPQPEPGGALGRLSTAARTAASVPTTRTCCWARVTAV